MNANQRKLALRLLQEGKSVREVARTFSVHPAHPLPHRYCLNSQHGSGCDQPVLPMPGYAAANSHEKPVVTSNWLYSARCPASLSEMATLDSSRNPQDVIALQQSVHGFCCIEVWKECVRASVAHCRRRACRR